jgi:hypothetical protein
MLVLQAMLGSLQAKEKALFDLSLNTKTHTQTTQPVITCSHTIDIQLP